MVAVWAVLSRELVEPERVMVRRRIGLGLERKSGTRQRATCWARLLTSKENGLARTTVENEVLAGLGAQWPSALTAFRFLERE